MGDDLLLDLFGHRNGWSMPAARAPFTVGDLAAVGSVGFEPVGPVTGQYLQRFRQQPVGCQPRVFNSTSVYANRRWGREASTITSGADWYLTRDNYIQVLYRARGAATHRLATECARLGADGVVGISLRLGPFLDHSHAWGLEMTGTAVRAQGRVRPPRPFLTHLSGADFAMLITSGWVPVNLAWGISVGVRHHDRATRRLTRRMSQNAFRNREVPAWTELVTATQTEARSLLRLDASRAGSEGAILSHLETRNGEQPCDSYRKTHDRLVECTLMGTAITQFGDRHVSPAPVLQL